MTPENLEKLADEELDALIARAHEIKKDRDLKRKNKAKEEARLKLEEAHAILLRAGLTPQDLPGARKAARKRPADAAAKAPAYRGGHQYQHPVKRDLIWNARGQKPGWLRQLEAEGGRAIEVTAASAA